MKKKQFITIMITVLAICTFFSTKAFASKNAMPKTSRKVTSHVKSKFKNGTLTIYGKGKMPNKMTFKKNKKIKKVVFKKGVTSVSPSAFNKCKNLKKVKFSKTVKYIYASSFYKCGFEGTLTIPKTVKYIGGYAFSGCKKLTGLKIPGNISYGYSKNIYREWCQPIFPVVKNITFTTPLNIRWVKYLKTLNFTVSKNDPNYKTVDGVIYTKDGSSIVRVPSQRKTITPIKSCKTFNLASVMYGTIATEEGEKICCKKLEKIVITKTIESITFTRDDKTAESYFDAPSNIKSMVIQSKKLNIDDLKTILNVFRYNFKEKFCGDYSHNNYLSLKSILEQLSYLVTNNDGMYITKDGLLVSNVSDVKERIIPEGVVEIWDYAFWFDSSDEDLNSLIKLEKVVFPSTLKTIGKYAFSDCTNLKELNLHNGITNIKKSAFMNCDSLTSITIPNSISKLNAFCFGYCDNLVNVTLPEVLTEIGNAVFRGCEKLTNINIPSTLKTIYENSFENTPIEKSVKKQYPKGVTIKPEP